MDKEISGVVVGVAGLGGLRESTIVKRLTEKLPGSATIFFDGHSVKMPKDFRRWLDAGADFDEWIAPRNRLRSRATRREGLRPHARPMPTSVSRPIFI